MHSHGPGLGDERLVDLFVIGGLWNVLTDSLGADPPADPKRLALMLMSQAAKRTGALG